MRASISPIFISAQEMIENWASKIHQKAIAESAVGTNLTQRVRFTPEVGNDAVAVIFRPKVAEKLPVVIVQGRYDVVCPMTSAWDLHRAFPEADLQIIADAGHSVSEKGVSSALIEAMDKIRDGENVKSAA